MAVYVRMKIIVMEIGRFTAVWKRVFLSLKLRDVYTFFFMGCFGSFPDSQQGFNGLVVFCLVLTHVLAQKEVRQDFTCLSVCLVCVSTCVCRYSETACSL